MRTKGGHGSLCWSVRVSDRLPLMKHVPVTETAATVNELAAVPRYGSKRDVAAMLQMSVRTVDNLVARGAPCLRISSRRLRFDMTEVRQWISETYRTQRRAPAKGAS